LGEVKDKRSRQGEIRWLPDKTGLLISRVRSVNGENENIDSVLDADHVSIVKPRRPSDLNYLLFRRFVLGLPRCSERGGGRSEHQEAFVKDVKTYFHSKDLDARTVDEYGSTNKQPLKDVEYRMKRCYGAVVLAPSKRTRIELGTSRPGAKLQQE